MNDKVMASVSLSFKADTMLSLVIEASKEDWIDGLACNAVKQLQYKFLSCDTISLVDERMTLN